MARGPTFRALALASCLIGIWFVAGPYPFHHAPTQVQLRHGWSHCADVILVGDSTLAWSGRPELVEAELHGYRVVNFGYSNASLADANYMAAAEAVLDPSTEHRAMVVAINSSDVDVQAAELELFDREAREIKKARRPPSVELDWQDELDLRLRPRGLCGLLWNLCALGTSQPMGYNGQLPIVTSYRDETFRVPDIENQFATDDAAYRDDITKAVFQHIVEARKHGIAVVAYVERDRPNIAAITEPHGYDPVRLERELRATGATVLDVPADLSTFDGVHYDPPSAERLSKLIGQALARQLPARTAAPGARCPWPLQTP